MGNQVKGVLNDFTVETTLIARTCSCYLRQIRLWMLCWGQHLALIWYFTSFMCECCLCRCLACVALPVVVWTHFPALYINKNQSNYK